MPDWCAGSISNGYLFAHEINMRLRSDIFVGGRIYISNVNLKNCPKCKTKRSIRQILWGMPDFENMPDPNKYLIGGCVLTGFDPTHECIKCGWQRMPKDHENFL